MLLQEIKNSLQSISEFNIEEIIDVSYSHRGHQSVKNSKDQLLEFAASGFRDFSRIAASSPEVWRDISLANKKAIISDLTLYKKEIDVLVEFIDNSQEGNLNDYLSKASSTRSEWAEDKK